ncbi:MAG: hypothetical protein IKM99_02980 [Bacteroidales bacterium]|nr:hypothetical protein [Bacteroidales bacterium]
MANTKVRPFTAQRELQIIEGMQLNTGLVRLTYFDKASVDKTQNSAIDDL